MNLSKQEGFMENDLLRVRKKLCMPSKMLLVDPSSWNECCLNKSWNKHEIKWSCEIESPSDQEGPISITPFQCPVSLSTVIQEKTILMSLDTIEAIMEVNDCSRWLALAKHGSDSFQYQTVLEETTGSVHVVSRTFFVLIVNESIIHSFNRPKWVDPC